ncbi:hypothetical protein [Enterobacter hormaechei]|uniref:hypothetical protein n=1 Tax=Enterobacter hormaechei TaxID=158836 RepID=UPI0039C145F0
MSTITKEQQKQILIDAANHVINRDNTSPHSENLRELARIALASLEAEPVAWLLSGGGAKNNVSFDSGNAYADPLREVTPLYTAPPAPVSVKIPPEKPHTDGPLADGWNACRAAMLQGAEPVTTAYKLPFEQWLSQQTGTIDVECGCVMTEVFFHWLRVAYEAGNSPVIPDGWVAVPVEPTKEMINSAMRDNETGEVAEIYELMLAAAPQQEVKP